MKWFRLYSETINDPKVIALRTQLRWYWIAVLCIANDQKERGTLPDSIETIALQLRVKPCKARRIIDDLINANLLEVDTSGGVRVHNWDGRQHRGDDAAERMRRSRARSKRPPMLRNSCATVTPPDTDTETEEETPPLKGVSLSPKPDPESVNDPAEVQRVAQRAERLFPACHHDSFVYQLGTEYPIGWIDAALTRASDQGKSARAYIRGILRGFQAEGGPPAPMAARASPFDLPRLPTVEEINRALGITTGDSTNGGSDRGMVQPVAS